MLKFFRKYNRVILVVGGCILMIAFLLPTGGQMTGMFGGGPGEEPVGEFGDHTITRNQEVMANREVQLLGRLPYVNLLTNLTYGDDRNAGLRYELLLREAQDLGLDAGADDVAAAIAASGINVNKLAADLKTQPEYIHEVIRRWLVTEQLRALLMGESQSANLDLPKDLTSASLAATLASGDSPGVNRILAARVAEAQASPYIQMMQAQGVDPRQIQMRVYSAVASEVQARRGRVSEPLLEHTLQDLSASVEGDLLLVRAADVLDQRLPGEAVPPAGEALVKELFEKYRDDLPGEGEPYGFGYKRPAQVRVQWLTVRPSQIEPTIQVSAAEALEEYRRDPGQYASLWDGQADVSTPDRAALERVRKSLRRRRAFEKARDVLQAAQRVMREQLPTERDGLYAKIGDDFQPMPLASVVERLRERYPDVRVEVTSTPEPVPVTALAGIEPLGTSRVVRSRSAGFPAYAQSARELSPEDDNPLVPLALQAKGPSELMISVAPRTDEEGAKGDELHVFRLIEVEPAKVPESLAAVDERVRQDAQRLAMYRQMKSNQGEWVKRAVEAGGLQALGQQVGHQPRALLMGSGEMMGMEGVEASAAPLRRRAPTGGRGGVEVPMIPDIGRSETLVDALFDRAMTLQQEAAASKGDLAALPLGQRLGAVPVEEKLGLAIYRIDAYRPVPRALFEQVRREPNAAAGVTAALPTLEAADPLDAKEVERRLGFVPDRPRKDEE